jgi:outer membrane protein TolC
MLREHVNQLDNDLADYAALERQLDRAENTSLPLASQKVDLLTAGYKAGRVDLSSVIAARRELIDEHLRLIDLQRQRAITAAQLHFAYGDETQ